MSNQPAYKCIVVTLHKNDHVAHSVDISSTGFSANLAGQFPAHIDPRIMACMTNGSSTGGNPTAEKIVPFALLGMTAVTGLVDAVSFLSLGSVFTASMTGNIAQN
jgi:hypothetical protein